MMDSQDVERRSGWLWAAGVIGFLLYATGALHHLVADVIGGRLLGDCAACQGPLSYFALYRMRMAHLTASWVVACWSGMIGVALLLLRSKLATPLLLTSFFGMVIASLTLFAGFASEVLIGGIGALSTMNTGTMIFAALIVVFPAILLRSARALHRQGVLS